MKVKQIKLGANYRVYGHCNPLTATSIRPADRKNGIWDTKVICTDTVTRQQSKHYPANLTPWDEYLNNKRVQQADKEETLRNAQLIIDAVGDGVIVSVNGPLYARLWFTEEAAETALRILGARPLPDNRRPSLFDEHDPEWERNCVLLGQRLKRAFGAGYAGNWLSDAARHPYVAELDFYNNIEKAAQRIAGRPGKQRSELSQLIA